MGGEVPVHDRRNELHLIAQLTEMTAQTVQLISIAKSVKDHLEHARYQAKMITNPARYKALATPWRLASALDSFAQFAGIAGNNRIIQALNTGIGAYDVWRNRGVLLGTYARTPPFLGTQIAYGRLELSDGLAGGAVDVVGRIRANAAATETAITELETDSFSLLPDDNTEIAVLNKINGAGMLSVRGQQDTNKLLASVTELGLAQEARIRDETARAINNDIAFTEGAQDALERQRQGFAAAARNWSF